MSDLWARFGKAFWNADYARDNSSITGRDYSSLWQGEHAFQPLQIGQLTRSHQSPERGSTLRFPLRQELQQGLQFGKDIIHPSMLTRFSDSRT
jgi:hypothetical protein